MSNSQEKKSVIHIADYGSPYPGNFIASLQALGQTVEAMGLRQVLILPKRVINRPWFKDLNSSYAPIYLLDTELSYFRLASHISKIAEKEKAVLIHTHFTKFDIPSFLSTILVKDKCFGSLPKLVWHVHSNFPLKSTINRKIKNIIKWNLIGNRNITVICDSEEIERVIREKGFAGDSYVVNNGIDIKRAVKTTISNSEFRKKLGIPEEWPLLLAFGWSPFVKGVDLLIKAVTDLHNLNLKLLIIGGDMLREYIYKQFTARLPENIIIEDPDICVGNLYNAADIFISSSRSEGCPYSVMEAMVNGLPIISSDIEALKWGHKVKGIYFFKSGDISDLKNKILEVLNLDNMKRSEVAKINSEFIKNNFSIDIWISNICRIYNQVLNTNGNLI